MLLEDVTLPQQFGQFTIPNFMVIISLGYILLMLSGVQIIVLFIDEKSKGS